MKILKVELDCDLTVVLQASVILIKVSDPSHGESVICSKVKRQFLLVLLLFSYLSNYLTLLTKSCYNCMTQQTANANRSKVT